MKSEYVRRHFGQYVIIQEGTNPNSRYLAGKITGIVTGSAEGSAGAATLENAFETDSISLPYDDILAKVESGDVSCISVKLKDITLIAEPKSTQTKGFTDFF